MRSAEWANMSEKPVLRTSGIGCHVREVDFSVLIVDECIDDYASIESSISRTTALPVTLIAWTTWRVVLSRSTCSVTLHVAEWS